MKIAREEIFGPVLVAQPFDDLEEVARRANDTEYGLAAGLWTRDISKAHKLAALLKAGIVYINTWGAGDPAAPVRRLQGVRDRPREGPRQPRRLPRDQDGLHAAVGLVRDVVLHQPVESLEHARRSPSSSNWIP